jgi:homoserine kinase type II
VLELLERFGQAPARLRPDLSPPGSPERCIARWAAEDTAGGLWLLERIAPAQALRRERMARLLLALAQAGLARLLPYRPCPDGGFVLTARGGCWQLSPFLPGQDLPAPDYAAREEPGLDLGSFLADLRQAAARADLPAGLEDFGQAAYVERLVADVARRDPGLLPRVARIRDRLTPFLEAEPHLPRALSHGDLHPRNAIWRGGRLAAAIDWEFAGIKHELYDPAQTLGCIGIEDPASFRQGAAAELVRILRGLLTPANQGLLRPAMAAARFGWLAEWLRRRDREMVALELDFLDLLLESGETPGG